MEEYLLKLKEKDNDFQLTIENELQSIKKKCNWLTTIDFGGLINSFGDYTLTAIYLHSKDGIDLIVRYNNINSKYEDLTSNVPKIYLLSEKVKKHLLRQKDIDYIQEELSEIEKIGRNIYKDVLAPIASISKNFEIYYTPNIGLSIYSDYDLIANYLNHPRNFKEKEFLKDEKSKEKLLKRILIKSNDKKINN